jgi:hypothetical protein
LYRTAGIKDIWICGTEKYFQYYHEQNGNYGTKRISEIETMNHVYYDSKTKFFHILDKNMDEKLFKSIKDEKKNINLMKTPSNYQQDKENFFIIKDVLNSYDSYSYYPSGRPSRKHPYPCKKYTFNENVSLTKCVSKNNVTFKDIS